jgi:NAD+ synthase
VITKWKRVVDDICVFIKNKTEGMNGVVIGISGGIDSALSAKLGVMALGEKNVTGLLLPYDYNIHFDDGDAICSDLGIQRHSVPIKDIVDAAERVSLGTNGKKTALTIGNIRARVRMMMLYAHANEYMKLVLGTTNKTEEYVGYFTKWGDGAVDIEPIIDLYKTEVWNLSRYLGLPKFVIDKKPTADLWAGQTDEDEIGVEYLDIDKYLMGTLKPSGDLFKIKKRIEYLHESSRHKSGPYCLMNRDKWEDR